MKSFKKAITNRIKAIYHLESMSWLRIPLRRWLVNLFGLVIVLCLYIIKPFKFVKLCQIHYYNIGDLAYGVDFLLRRIQLENTPGKRIIYLGISGGKPANQQLLIMFKRKLPIIQSRFAWAILHSYIIQRSIFYESLDYFGNDKFYEFNNTELNLHFTESEEDEGRKLLNELGIDRNSWFICFHSRDPVYLSNQWRKRYGPRDWDPQDFRDTDIKNYLEAAKYIASLGGFAVRVGYGVAEKLPALNNPRIIDYASYHRTDFGDIYLPAKCKFFLGSPSGLCPIPTIFNVPLACADFIRFNSILFRKGAILIPKKIWSIREKRVLTFREILESEVADYALGHQYAEAGLEAVENIPGEILDLAIEMNERLDGTFETTEEDEVLQSRFHSLFPQHLYSYSAPIRIGAQFLRQNKELLK